MGATLKGFSIVVFVPAIMYFAISWVFMGRADGLMAFYVILYSLMLMVAMRYSQTQPLLGLDIGWKYIRTEPWLLLGGLVLWVLMLPWVLFVKEMMDITEATVLFSPVPVVLEKYGLFGAVMTFGLAPIAEEYFFRHFLYGNLANRMAPFAAALISSVVYGLSHTHLLLIGSMFVVGMVQCFFYERVRALSLVIFTNIVLQILLSFMTKI